MYLKRLVLETVFRKSVIFQEFDEALQILGGIDIGILAAGVVVLAALRTLHAGQFAGADLAIHILDLECNVVNAFSVLIQMILPKVKRANQANANAETAPAADDKNEEGGVEA